MSNHSKFGSHLIYDAYECDPSMLNSREICEKMLLDLAKVAHMTPICNPIVVEASGNETLGGKDPGGFSGFLIIQESHISVHTFYRRRFVTIDLYSCKEFEKENAIKFLDDLFKPANSEVIKLDRGLKYPKENLI